MLVQMLILVFGFTLFNAFALHSQLVRWGELTLKALAHELDLAQVRQSEGEVYFFHGRSARLCVGFCLAATQKPL
jgi:hypothetical protein